MTRRAGWFLLLLAPAAIVGSLFIGSSAIPAAEVTRILTGGGSDELQRTIVLDLRLPRAFLAFIVGASLAGAGVVFQAIFRNPLADPYVTGVSGGAALGAVAAMLAGFSWSVLGLAPASLAAFLGAGTAVILVARLSLRGGRIRRESLLLAGFAVGSFAAAMVSYLLLRSTRNWNEVLAWLLGNLAEANWARVRVALPYVAAALAAMHLIARDLNLMLLGDESAQQLGARPERVKRIALAAGTVATAVPVALCGIIGFVGLIVPHAVRRIVGPDHRTLIPASALAGGTFLVLADIAARALLPPAGLPAGVATALCGAPFFVWVLVRKP